MNGNFTPEGILGVLSLTPFNLQTRKKEKHRPQLPFVLTSRYTNGKVVKLPAKVWKHFYGTVKN